MSEFNFKSSICTSLEQSERLLALGLKKETADMTHHYQGLVDYYELKDIAFTKVMHLRELTNKNPILGRSGDDLYAKDIPAWSLHRLIEMYDVNPKAIFTNDAYGILIDEIEESIKEGYFNEEYLV